MLSRRSRFTRRLGPPVRPAPQDRDYQTDLRDQVHRMDRTVQAFQIGRKGPEHRTDPGLQPESLAARARAPRAASPQPWPADSAPTRQSSRSPGRL